MNNQLKSTKKRKYISIQLLNAFTEKELEGFSNFISYNYFNTDKILIKLLVQLRKHVIGKSQQFSDSEVRIYNNIFPDLGNAKELNFKQRKRLNSKLNAIARLAEKFLCINALDEDNFNKNELLYKALLNKKQYELFNRKISNAKKRLSQIEIKESSYYYEMHKIETYIFTSIYQKELMSTEDNLNEQNRYLDIYFIIEKLNLYISMLSSQPITQRSYNNDTIELIWKLVNYQNYENIPLIEACKATIFLLKEQSETAYTKLIQLLDELKNKLLPNDLTTLYNIALNFCILQIKRGKFSYKEIFIVYKNLDTQNLLLEDNYIPSIKLKNVLTAGCRVGSFEWVMEILNKYYPFIRKPIRESVFQFNLGAIAFYKNKFDEALRHFIKVDHVNISYDSNCRLMMLKAHYEIDEDYDERTLQIYRSTEKYFLENKALSSINKRAYKNFIRMLINLYRIKHQATKMTVASFQKKLDAQEINSDKSWLKEKLAENIELKN